MNDCTLLWTLLGMLILVVGSMLMSGSSCCTREKFSNNNEELLPTQPFIVAADEQKDDDATVVVVPNKKFTNMTLEREPIVIPKDASKFLEFLAKDYTDSSPKDTRINDKYGVNRNVI